jgi:hypothetical protein
MFAVPLIGCFLKPSFQYTLLSNAHPVEAKVVATNWSSELILPVQVAVESPFSIASAIVCLNVGAAFSLIYQSISVILQFTSSLDAHILAISFFGLIVTLSEYTILVGVFHPKKSVPDEVHSEPPCANHISPAIGKSSVLLRFVPKNQLVICSKNQALWFNTSLSLISIMSLAVIEVGTNSAHSFAVVELCGLAFTKSSKSFSKISSA